MMLTYVLRSILPSQQSLSCVLFVVIQQQKLKASALLCISRAKIYMLAKSVSGVGI